MNGGKMSSSSSTTIISRRICVGVWILLLLGLLIFGFVFPVSEITSDSLLQSKWIVQFKSEPDSRKSEDDGSPSLLQCTRRNGVALVKGMAGSTRASEGAARRRVNLGVTSDESGSINVNDEDCKKFEMVARLQGRARYVIKTKKERELDFLRAFSKWNPVFVQLETEEERELFWGLVQVYEHGGYYLPAQRLDLDEIKVVLNEHDDLAAALFQRAEENCRIGLFSPNSFRIEVKRILNQIAKRQSTQTVCKTVSEEISQSQMRVILDANHVDRAEIENGKDATNSRIVEKHETTKEPGSCAADRLRNIKVYVVICKEFDVFYFVDRFGELLTGRSDSVEVETIELFRMPPDERSRQSQRVLEIVKEPDPCTVVLIYSSSGKCDRDEFYQLALQIREDETAKKNVVADDDILKRGRWVARTHVDENAIVVSASKARPIIFESYGEVFWAYIYSAKPRADIVFARYLDLPAKETITMHFLQGISLEGYGKVEKYEIDKVNTVYPDGFYENVLRSKKYNGTIFTTKTVLQRRLYFTEALARWGMCMNLEKAGIPCYQVGLSIFKKEWGRDLLKICHTKPEQSYLTRAIECRESFKFSLSFENSYFRGYVSEKIFMPRFVHSVPIYFGAPDITDYIHENAFVHCNISKATVQYMRKVWPKKEPRKFDPSVFGTSSPSDEELVQWATTYLAEELAPCIEKVKLLDSNDDLYLAMLKHPFAKDPDILTGMDMAKSFHRLAKHVFQHPAF